MIEYKLKKFNFLFESDRLWRILTSIVIVSIYLMLKGSTAPLILDNHVIRFLFYSNPEGDKTLYNIAISYFAAYIFYIIQVYIPERRKNKKALLSTYVDAYNYINQVLDFLFMWDHIAVKTTDGVITSANLTPFFYKLTKYDVTHVGNIDELKLTLERAREDYEKIISNSQFDKFDNYVIEQYIDLNVPDELEKLYILTKSAKTMSDTGATIYETFSPTIIELIKAKMMVLKFVYGFYNLTDRIITDDKQDIEKWIKQQEDFESLINENRDFFNNLPEDYDKAIK